jgi:phage terminase small subunit
MKKLSKQAAKLKKAIVMDYSITDDAGLAILQTAMEAFDLMHEAQTAVDERGLTVPGDRGGTKAHPLLAVIRDARAQFLMALKHLNLEIEPLRDKPGRPGGR